MPSLAQAAKFVLPLALAAAAAPMIAQMPMEAPGKLDPKRVTAGTYAADPSHSLIGWQVNHLGFNPYFGLFGDVSGTLIIDPANLAAAKVTATIPVSKIVTVNPELTAHLLRAPAAGAKPDFFGPAPADATFVSTSVVPAPDGISATINGNLTLNGVTKSVSILARFFGAGTNVVNRAVTIGFLGFTAIKRSDFGMNFIVPLVSDEVPLNITIAFEKK
jgi:polyisoprenoid-binding protein YceI